MRSADDARAGIAEQHGGAIGGEDAECQAAHTRGERVGVRAVDVRERRCDRDGARAMHLVQRDERVGGLQRGERAAAVFAHRVRIVRRA